MIKQIVNHKNKLGSFITIMYYTMKPAVSVVISIPTYPRHERLFGTAPGRHHS